MIPLMRRLPGTPCRRLHALLPALLPAALLASACAHRSPVQPAADEVATPDPGIMAAVRAMNDVCARRDLPGFMALFEDSDAIALIGSDTGEVFKGRDAVAGFMKRLFALPFTFSFDLPDPMVGQRGDSAWVFVDGAMIHTAADGRSRRVPYRITAVLARHAGAWRWQLFSGASPRPE